MTTLALKNVPDELYRRLESVARAKRRTIDEEAVEALAKGLDREEVENVPTIQPIALLLRPHAIGLTEQTTFRREELYSDDGR